MTITHDTADAFLDAVEANDERLTDPGACTAYWPCKDDANFSTFTDVDGNVHLVRCEYGDLMVRDEVRHEPDGDIARMLRVVGEQA